MRSHVAFIVSAHFLLRLSPSLVGSSNSAARLGGEEIMACKTSSYSSRGMMSLLAQIAMRLSSQIKEKNLLSTSRQPS